MNDDLDPLQKGIKGILLFGAMLVCGFISLLGAVGIFGIVFLGREQSLVLPIIVFIVPLWILSSVWGKLSE